MLGAEPEDRVVVDALAVEIDRDDCLGELAEFLARGDLLGEQTGVHVPRRQVAIDEHRRRADVADRVDRCGERERRGQHLVTGTDTEHLERQMERRRAARQRHRVTNPDLCREFQLERINVRPQRCNPVGIERIKQ